MGKIKEIQQVDIDRLVPYENNAKIHNKAQLEKLMQSIKEFGFVNPVIIDKDFNIIAGHGRTEAAKLAGMKKIPCLRVDGLTEEQKKAYIIADNRLAEFGEWNKELVQIEMDALTDIEMDFDIDMLEFPRIHEFEPVKSYGEERKRTDNAYNLEIAHETTMTDDFWQMPVIKRCDCVPERLIGFNYAKSSKDKNCGIHFFVDDYQFERIWNKPEDYIEILAQYDCILTPDFSLYMDMPMPMKIWNIYRSRQIGAFYQRCGLKVIPTISWAEEETFKFAFKGIERGSTVAISTVGVKENAGALKVWENGAQAMIKAIKPSLILCYGGKVDFDYKNVTVKYYDNEMLKEWRARNDENA